MDAPMPPKGIAETSIEQLDSIGEKAPCLTTGALPPCAIIIFGATGDLTARKLFPSLYTLMSHGILTNTVIIGAARSSLDHGEFRSRMKEALEKENSDMTHWEACESRIFYQQVDYTPGPLCSNLIDLINRLDKQFSLENNKLFYLAVPPAVYPHILDNLGREKALVQQSSAGWTRLIIEKPFGRDMSSSHELNVLIKQHFLEKQIYRIDHYLAKETVQNILMLRFANTIFEPVWNRNYISAISIEALESIGVEHRGTFYEETGVLRDIFQNHMLQLLALVTMEPPALIEADRVRDERTKVLRNIRPFPAGNPAENLVLGQYGSGTVNGKPVPGYTGEQGVAPDSKTPTYAGMKVFIDNWRWQGVPIYLTAGKRLAKKKTAITIYFKEVPSSLFSSSLNGDVTANRLSLGIYPEEQVQLTFQAKVPGAKMCLRPVTMDFHYNQGYEESSLDAYEKAIIDAIQGEQTLFLSQDAVDLGWHFLTPLLEMCDTAACPMLYTYAAGSMGPEAVQNMSGRISQS